MKSLESLISDMETLLQGIDPSTEAIQLEADVLQQILELLRELRSRRGSGFRRNTAQEEAAFEEIFRRWENSTFGSAFRSSSRAYEEAFGSARQQRKQEETFNWGNNEKQRRAPPKRGKPWFEVLGIPPDSNRDTIMRAYRKLASKHHPDRAGGSTTLMAEINKAKDEGLAGL